MKYKTQKNRNGKVGIGLMACCDCGLVHKIGITMDKDATLRLDYQRDNQATAQLRRGNFPYLKRPLKSDKWKMVRNGTEHNLSRGLD